MFNKRTLLLASIAAISMQAHALSEGEAALVGGLIGYGIRAHQNNQQEPQRQYIPPTNRHNGPEYIIQQQQQGHPHLNDACSRVTIVNGEYNPAKAQWVCRRNFQ